VVVAVVELTLVVAVLVEVELAVTLMAVTQTLEL
jgi:hypothetical protein